MSKKDKADKAVKNLHEQIVSGKGVVHTKTAEQSEKDKKEKLQKEKAAFVGAMVYLGATLLKLEELMEYGSTKQKTKMLVGQTLKSMEHDLDKIFDIKAEDNGSSAETIQEGSEFLEKGLDLFLRQRTDIYEE